MKAHAISAAMLMVNVAYASATVRISDDAGGQIGDYAAKYRALRSSGETVMIDGICASACTMPLGTIPRNRICVTRRAILAFTVPVIRRRQGMWPAARAPKYCGRIIPPTYASGSVDMADYDREPATETSAPIARSRNRLWSNRCRLKPGLNERAVVFDRHGSGNHGTSL
jgi:hypothetical protein